MSDLALGDRENWSLLLTQSKTVVRYSVNERRDSLYEYAPISPIYCNAHSHLLLIGAKSDSALSHWYLGAIASQFLYVSPSMSEAFTSGVQVGDSVKIRLNSLTLVEFKDYDVFNYVVELKIPHWLEDVTVEVWEYEGFLEPGIREVLERVDSIEDKIDAIQSNGA